MASPIPNRGSELYAIDIAFLAAAVIAYGLRVYVRTRMIKSFGRDDYLMAAATVAFIAYCSSSMLGVHYGTGRHRWHLTVENYAKGRHCWWFCYLFYCCSMITSKLSIGFFILRIAVKKIHIWIIYSAMMISVVAGLAFFFVTLFQCHPISYFWNDYSQSGSCVNIEIIIALGYLYSCFSIISDFTFAILPAFLVMGLQLKKRTKIALIPLLAMGCIASAAVVARVPYMKQFRSKDFLWETTDIAIWSTVEQGLAITAGSLAAVRPLFQMILTKLGLTTQRSTVPLTPYGYGNRSGSHAFRERRPSAAKDLDLYTLSAEAESGTVRDNSTDLVINDANKELPKPPHWYETQMKKIKRSSKMMPESKTIGDNESEKSLRLKESKSEHDLTPSRTHSDERSMQIMVERSFFVTDAERRSYVEQQDHKG
ncbi:hypothetical protein DPSP01_012291 [Paraphaeosphaeria sporulosa]|uniref:Rhodopsin domain-containing protein n=1 Tax=Paraphaeosphaeria sporulosa TaxID=1460663 RepID=A0A177CV18_9PLEO|nr:uncharacterized protein CC84DRAFT_1113085 [Paraphaeosphaeria sporulosa]OAG10637.1 hypothetical protein CC84DRAFT_1113085 [Paraphaeosphaeria sporulosa]